MFYFLWSLGSCEQYYNWLGCNISIAYFIPIALCINDVYDILVFKTILN